MSEGLLGFVLWAALGIVFIIYGIFVSLSEKEKPFGFWANAEQFPVNDVKGYNQALGKLFAAFGIVFTLLGVPLLKGENSGTLVITIIGTMFSSIAMMGIYVTVIEKKYRTKK